MENKRPQQSETLAGQSKKRNGRKRLSMTGLELGVIATILAVIWLSQFTASSKSRQSTPAEIAAQEEFQLKFDTANNEAVLKLHSIGK